MKPSFTKEDCDLKEVRTVYQGFFTLQVYRFKHRLFAGGWSEEYEREIFERGESACVLLYDPEQDKVVLVEQFRAAAMASPSGPWSLELVAGMVDKGNKPEQTVRQEVQEEAGCQVQNLFPIGSCLLSPGGTTERVWLFCGTVDSTAVGGIHGLDDEHEDIKVHVVSRLQAFEWLEEDAIDNATTIIGLRWLQVNWDKKFKKIT